MPTDIAGDTNTATVLDRATTALEAYLTHNSWTLAAQAAGYTNKGSAYRAAMRLLGQRADATAAELRRKANQRHAEKIAMLEDIIYDLDAPMADRLKAVDAHTRAEVRHAALNGLDAPKQVQVSAGVMAEMEQAFGELRLVVMGDVVDSEDSPGMDALEG